MDALGYIFWTRTIELCKRLKKGRKKAIGTAKTASKVFAKKKSIETH